MHGMPGEDKSEQPWNFYTKHFYLVEDHFITKL
jgi:hypothetical protein